MTTTNTDPQLYTCISCHSVFPCLTTQKTHYRSDWHRYNLNRKIQDLPPLTEASYLTRMEAEEKKKANEPEKRKRWACECKKTFSSEKALANHSKNVHSTDKNDSVHEYEVKEIQEGECFLCNDNICDSLEALIDHLTTEHGLYLPDLEYISDLPGLITYLQGKVCVLHACLYCHDDEMFSNESVDENKAAEMLFRAKAAVINHMHDKGHAKIRFDEIGQAELVTYYNYEKEESFEHVSEIITDDNDEKYEDVSDDDSVANETENVVWVTPDESELILPTGARIGNRAYKRYYKQNLLPYSPDNTQQYLQRQSSLVSRLMLKYSEVGQPTHGYRTARNTDISRNSYSNPDLLTDTQARRDQQVENDARKKQELGVGTRSNKLQKHFREQIL